MPTYTSFDYVVADHVATITLNQPQKRNAMSRAFWTEMKQVFAAIGDDPGVRAVVIASTGPHFTAGIDLALLGEVMTVAAGLEDSRKRERLRRMVLEFQESFNVIEASRVPVLAAIQGGCIGGGIDMTTACDMRYCTADAFFLAKEIEVGMTADVGTLQRLPRLIPDGLARELCYTGRRMGAEEANACGLVNSIYPDQATMLDEVAAMARCIAAHSPLAVTGTKEMLNYGRDHSIADGLNYIATWNAGMLLSEDLMKSAIAAQSKETPAYDDLAVGPENELSAGSADAA